jgi:release factor glutamine methyltransferase
VGPGVLVPRPDSEVLIEAAVAYLKSSPFTGRGTMRSMVEGGCRLHNRVRPSPPSVSPAAIHLPVNGEDLRILDLGTGSGALLLAALAEFPQATGLGIDASEAALAIARRNADRVAPGRAEMRLGDWAEGIDERFDLILCNPPYIEEAADLPPDVRDYEPPGALFAGAEGLDAYRILIPQLPRLLTPGGMIAVEIGHTQAEAVQALFTAVGLSSEIRKDLAGRPRAIVHFALGKPKASA